jgi:hypothetical protein
MGFSEVSSMSNRERLVSLFRAALNEIRGGGALQRYLEEVAALADTPGPTGPTGPAGPTGATGPTGPTGATGADGSLPLLGFARLTQNKSTASAGGIPILSLPITKGAADALVVASFCGYSSGTGSIRFALLIDGAVVQGSGVPTNDNLFLAGAIQYRMDTATYPAGNHTLELFMYGNGGADSANCDAGVSPQFNNAALVAYSIG